MQKKIAILMITMALTVVGIAETWRLGNNREWQKVADGNNTDLTSAVAEAKQLVATGQRAKAKKAYENIRKNHPELAGGDYDAYVKAELLYAKRKFPEAAQAYENMIENYPQSALRQAAMEREYQIGTAFLNGQKRTVLKVFKLNAYEEGTEIMNKIADTAGDAPIAKKSIETLAVSREKRGAYDEAYLAWADAANRWPTGDMGQESLLGMARSLEKDYRGPAFDGKVLISSRSYYSEYIERYPQPAEQMNLTGKIGELDVKLAEKELLIANFYARTGSYTAANLYYQKIIDTWPTDNAAKIAEQKIPEMQKQIAQAQLPKKKKVNWKGLFL